MYSILSEMIRILVLVSIDSSNYYHCQGTTTQVIARRHLDADPASSMETPKTPPRRMCFEMTLSLYEVHGQR